MAGAAANALLSPNVAGNSPFAARLGAMNESSLLKKKKKVLDPTQNQNSQNNALSKMAASRSLMNMGGVGGIGGAAAMMLGRR